MRFTLSLCSVFALVLLTGVGCGEVVSGDPDGGTLPGGDGGVVDPCSTMPCECDENSDCGTAARCETSASGRACVCYPGFEDVGGECVWGVAPRDPGFQDPTVWQAIRGGGVSPLSTGSMDAGEAFFGVDSVCNLGAVAQTFPMPPYDVVGPLVASVTYRMLGGGGPFPGPGFGSIGVGVAFGGGWSFLPPELDWATQRICLGERAYAGEVDMRVAPSERPLDCNFDPTTMLAVDHLQIGLADPGECPEPATVLNGDFELEASWELVSGASIVDGVGNNGSRALRLATAMQCESAEARGRGSWPSQSVQSPAIELWWSGTTGRALNIRMADRFAGTLIGTGRPQVSRLCIPPAVQGVTSTITWSLPFEGSSCGQPDVREAVIDDIRVVNEPACGTSPVLLGAGFEEFLDGRIVSTWNLQAEPGRARAQILNNSGLAHSGNGVLELMVQQECSASAATTNGVVPLPMNDAGPALKFWYNAPGNPQSDIFTTPGNGAALAETGTWVQQTVCLDPNSAGRPIDINFRLDRGFGTCANTFPAETVRFDDVELTTDPSCLVPRP